ncbi:MAG: hypothetical protein JWM87_2961 [Candidatus Eremiobacteraeota bacterium]|nr:hypothetical protein [Candidatus Eremiobacteraeota bacterium]
MGTLYGMTCVGESVLHALSVEPSSARAGDIVRVTFRTRNLGTQGSPAGRVVFALGDGLEADDGMEVDLDSVAPGEYAVATIRARVGVPVADRMEIAVCAALHLEDAVLGTNTCRVTVLSRAVLDGPASGAFVEAVDADTVRVRVVVTNEGDGPACGVRIVVPAPIGCVSVDGDSPIEHAIERLDPGEHSDVAFEARIVAPVAEIRADAGEVRFPDGRRVALPARDAVLPAPILAPPRVVLTSSRRRVDVAMDLRNDGWADAHAVRVQVTLPPPVRLIDGSVVLDGVPVGTAGTARRRAAHRRDDVAIAHMGRDGAALVVTLSTVPARSTVRVAMAALVPAACCEDVISVGFGEHRIELPFVPNNVQDVRVRVIDSPLTASPGDVVRVVARVINGGDVPETISIGVADGSLSEIPATASRTLAPGTAAAVALAFVMTDDARDGDVLDSAVFVRDANGERARAAFSVIVRDRAWPWLEAPPESDGTHVRYTVRNGGSTAARDVTARFEDVVVRLDPIAAGATAVLAVEERTARCGGALWVAGREVLDLPALEDRAAPAVHAALYAPERVIAGAPFAARLNLDVEDAADALAISVPGIPGGSYVPGSTLLDGRGLLDRAACTLAGGPSPLGGDGLSLRGVPGGTRITVSWSLIADPVHGADSIAVSAALRVDGEDRPIAAVTVAVGERDPFPVRPSGARYHVEACMIPAAAVDGEPAFSDGASLIRQPQPAISSVQDEPRSGAGEHLIMERSDVTGSSDDGFDRSDVRDSVSDATTEPCREPRLAFGMRLDAARIEDIVPLLHAARGRGLVAHLFVLRFFFPDSVDVQDVSVSEALCAVQLAVRDVFDRLFVKLRIPGFDVSADDLEDAALRGALVVLFERLLGAAPDRVAFEESPAALDRDRVRRMLAAFADAPYGAPAVLRALVALLPTSCADDPALATALRRHANLLDDVLSRYDGLPLELFDDALAHRFDAALDGARDVLLAALSTHAPAAEAAC